MCNHIYTISPYRPGITWEKHCRYPELYASARQTSSTIPGDLQLTLPIDGSGECIFHSGDVDWKRENDFPGRFLELLRLLETMGEKFYDFTEFVFVGTELKETPAGQEHVLRLHDLTILEDANFFGATFIDRLDLEAVRIKVRASFRHATFLQGLVVSNSRINSLSFLDATIAGALLLTEVHFLTDTSFAGARFTGAVADSFVRFENVSFDGTADFSNAVFMLGPESGIVMRWVVFRKFTTFRNVQFRCTVNFKDIGFLSVAEFIDTSFSGTKPFHSFGYVNPNHSRAVAFVDINVGAGALLTFMSTDPRVKLFEHEVEFDLWDEALGTVRFENVNFNRISDESRTRLVRLAKEGRVEIGPGCIKYRVQTGVRTIFMDRGNAPLVLELCQTFTSYFTVSNGVNLGFEVVEQTAGKVSFFYFSDEDISEVEFLERLANTERQLWNLLSESPADLRALNEPGGTAVASGGRRTLINAVDGVSALMGTLFRAGVRIAVGAWQERDTRSLLAAIRFNGEGAEERARTLHEALVDRYTGQALFGFSQKQNRLLAPMAGAAVPRPADQKVTILFLGANSSSSPLDLELEVKKIQDNLKMARERENLVLKQEWAVTVDSLFQAMLDESPTIVHFAGHGNELGIILNGEDNDTPREVPAEALSELFRLFRDTVQCVVLNSCYSEHQAYAIRQHIPYVIGMRDQIPDSAAMAFSTGFYKAIGAGRDIPFAFDMGEVRMKMEGFDEEVVPILI